MSAASRKSESAVERDTEPDASAPVYALLAELLSREIDASLLAVLRIPDVRELLDRVEGEAGAVLDGWDEGRGDEHAVEFCRLFVRPGLCLPLAGRWFGEGPEDQFSVDRWLPQEVTATALPPHLAELPATHVARILATRSGLSEASPGLIEQFEAEMIRPWAADFAERLRRTTSLTLYRGVAEILRALG